MASDSFRFRFLDYFDDFWRISIWIFDFLVGSWGAGVAYILRWPLGRLRN
jgi:hypothetical protein